MHRFFRRVRLRTLLIVAFAFQAILAVLLTEIVSLRNVDFAVSDLSGKLRVETADRISEQLYSLFNIAHLINETNLIALERGDIDLALETHNPVLDRYLIEQMELFESVRWISLASEDGGNYLGVYCYALDDALYIVEVNKETDFRSTAYHVTADGARADLAWQNDRVYDARTRPWYKSAVKAGRSHWCEIYRDAGSPRLYLTASAPVYNKSNDLLGVCGVDIDLKDISEYLNSISFSEMGEIFIIDKAGTLIASRYDEASADSVSEDISNQIQANQSSKPLIAATMDAFSKEFSSMSLVQINESCQFDFNYDGKRDFVQISPFSDGRGIDWLIVLVMPEESFLNRVYANRRTTIMLCLVAALIAIFIGMMLANWITNPIRQLNEGAKSLAKGEWEKSLDVSREDEIGELSRSFNSMAVQLTDLVSSLEEKVQKRTKQLNLKNEEVTKQNKTLQALNTELQRLRGLEQKEKIKALEDVEKAQLEALRSQLNPHFLYNSLNSILALVELDPKAAAEMILKLSSLCRLTLTQDSDKLSTVSSELDVISNYLSLEKIRWSEKLVYTSEIEEGLHETKIPPFLFQTLVENAIKYGQRTSPLPLQIELKVRSENGRLLLEVNNTGKWYEQDRSDKAGGTNIGISNLKKRLVRFFHSDQELRISCEDGWVRVTIDLPFHYNDDCTIDEHN